jgi:hypothetical protein
MTTKRAQLDIDLTMLNGYIYAGNLKYINGEWRWDRDGFANDIVLTEQTPKGYSPYSLHTYLQQQGDLIHSLTD